MQREWAEEISVYDTLTYAADRARAAHFRLGRWIVALILPAGSLIEVRQTGHNTRHFTIYASADEIMALVAGEAIFVEDV